MFGLIISCGTVATLIIAGYAMKRTGFRGSSRIYASVAAVSSLLVLTGAVIALTSGASSAAESAAAAKEITVGAGIGFMAASLATGIACLAAGSAAIGLVGEKPEMLGTTLIYLGLAEGIAIYGIIISLLIIQRL